MLEAFQPELHDQSLAPGGENYYANPLGNRLLTQGTCWNALQAASQPVWDALTSGTQDFQDFKAAIDALNSLGCEYTKRGLTSEVRLTDYAGLDKRWCADRRVCAPWRKRVHRPILRCHCTK
jgi:hypothetical protein